MLMERSRYIRNEIKEEEGKLAGLGYYAIYESHKQKGEYGNEDNPICTEGMEHSMVNIVYQVS